MICKLSPDGEHREIYDYRTLKYTGRVGPMNDGNTFLIDNCNASCGISALWGVRSYRPKDIVERVLGGRDPAKDYRQIKEAFVVFSDTEIMKAREDCGGFALAKYIRDHNLGTLLETDSRMNPNTGNIITMWVWYPPHKDLRPIVKANFEDNRFEENRV